MDLQKNIIICPDCGKFPNIRIILDKNDNNIIKYKCHNNDYISISPEEFLKYFIKEQTCYLCKEEYSFYCIECNNYFCKDDFLYHIMLNKHKKENIDCKHNMKKLFFCFNCKMKICKICEKNTIHGPHQILSKEHLLLIYRNIFNFIQNFRELNLKRNNINNTQFIDCLSNICNTIKNYIEKDISINKCIIFLESLNLSIIKYLTLTEYDKFR